MSKSVEIRKIGDKRTVTTRLRPGAYKINDTHVLNIKEPMLCEEVQEYQWRTKIVGLLADEVSGPCWVPLHYEIDTLRPAPPSRWKRFWARLLGRRIEPMPPPAIVISKVHKLEKIR